MFFQPPVKKKIEVNLIPLINVIFLLLIFFMVAGTVERIDIFEVELPMAENGGEKVHTPAVIYLGADGEMAINNDYVQKKDFKTIISTVFINENQKKVTIKSDNKVPAERLLWVMQQVEDAGAEDVLLVTEEIK
jgi:biopolymer transport protein ExbD